MLTLEQRVEAALDSVRAFIQSDGGDVKLIRIEEAIVYVTLTGACVGCPLSSMTLKMGIEEAVREQVPEITQVVAIE
jgi:Fe-S cluster biogenesis protein NfuA